MAEQSKIDRVHVLLQLVLQYLLEVDLELEPEPDEDIQSGDVVIGPVSDEVKRLHALRRKMSQFAVGSIDQGLRMMVDEIVEDRKQGIVRGKDEFSEGARIFHRVTHPHMVALSHVAHQLFKWAVVCDAFDRDLHDKEIEMRKGWVAVWRSPEEGKP